MQLLLRALLIGAVVGVLAPMAVLYFPALTNASTQTSEPRSVGDDLYRRGLYAEAIAWYTEQAAKGDAAAARRLGVEYMDGKGGVVQRDYEKARSYHLQAAKAGDSRSMFDLGTIYEGGLGVPADLIEAGKWFEWAAKYGHPQGQYNFATMIETGEAGRKDEVEAYMYYLLAASQGVGGIAFDLKTNRVITDGETPLGQLKRRLTPAQIDEATARAKAFKPLEGPMPN